MRPSIFALSSFGLVGTAWGSTNCSSTPIVDLGYAVHQATYNDTFSLYNFSNIHYADAPRFGAPTAVSTINRTINLGQTVGTCPWVNPGWNTLSAEYLTSAITLAELNSTFTHLQNMNASEAQAYVTAPNSLVTEDCLTLDVVVPDAIWNGAKKNVTKAPVMVWIVGGGYVLGDKNAAGDPSGLIAKSQEDGSDGVIYVTLNYRLGLFGWMSGPQLEAQGGISNLGLLDQRFALEWVQKYIHLFGGDANNVTVFGESAGAGSIMHQITAYGSNTGAPFQKAILQSAAFQVMPQTSTQDQNFNKALYYASLFSGSNITTLDEMKQLSFDILYKVNQITVSTSDWGLFTWGPGVSGDFVPDLPGVLLADGKFDSSVEVIAAHNSNEGYLFANPLITDEAGYVAYLQTLAPEASSEVIQYISTVLYPPVYNGTYPWTTLAERVTKTISESWFNCNSRYVNKALANTARGYYFDVLLGWHGNDLPYTYWNGETTSSGLPITATIAARLQNYLTTFAKTGSPNSASEPFISVYGTNSSVEYLSEAQLLTDDAANVRCDWWQQALFR